MLFKEDLFAMLEAVLFVSTEPLAESRLMEVLGTTKEELEDVLEDFEEGLRQPGRGIELLKVAGGYKLQTKKSTSDVVEKVAKPQGGQLSRAALETLAIIAYKQPITRSEVESIRGVGVDNMFYKLLERELIIEVGRKEVPGRPNLYGTTDRFLMQLGLGGLEQLPEIMETPEEHLSQEELDYNNESLAIDLVPVESLGE